MKKVIITATAIALLSTPAFSQKTEAAQLETNYQYTHQHKNVNKLFKYILMNIDSHKNCFVQLPVEKEEPKQETPKQEEPKQEEPKQETPKQEEPKQEVPNQQPSTEQQPPKQENTEKNETTTALNAYEQKVVELTNVERSKNGLAPFKIDEQLSKVAREKSRDMSVNRYFDHTSPTYGSPFDMMKKYGITYRTAGENIAMGQRTPEEVVKAWMNSAGHRANILSKDYTHIGVGYIENGNYWTQQFIGK